MKEMWKSYGNAIGIPLLAGGLVGILTAGGMKGFEALVKPPLSPPGWLFPIVWTVLYTLMGIASGIVWKAEDTEQRKQALFLYGLQLIVNLLWPFLFFTLEWYFFSFAWLVLLWVLVYETLRSFWPVSKRAALLLLPYLVWLTLAGYLNLGVWWLNR